MAERRFPYPPKGNKVWSYGQLRDWACPLHGHLRRDKKLHDLPSPQLYKGRIAHDVISAYCAHLVTANVEADPNAIDQIARDVYFAATGELHGLGMEAWPEILDLARHFAEQWTMPLATLLSQEEIWLVKAFGTHYLWVIADLVEAEGDTAIIRDFKTDWHLRSDAEVEEDEQLPIYAWGVWKQWHHFRRFRCCLHFLRHGKERWVEFTPADMVEVDKALRAEIERIEAIRASAKFPAAPGRTCRYCPFTEQCPAITKTPELLRITTPAEAETVAGALTAIDHRRGLLRDALHEWTSVNGSVTVGGVEWGHLLSESVTIPPDLIPDLVDSLATAGLNPYAILRVDAQELKALLARPQTAPIVEPYVIDSSSTSFRSRKAPPGGKKEAAT